MHIHSNINIGDLFTWRVQATARYLVFLESWSDVTDLIATREYQKTTKRYVLGKGANTLFASAYYDGMVMVMQTQGIEKVREDTTHTYWRVMAGEDWMRLVEQMTMQNNMGGLENLAYIPGAVGSAPIQNIAAYGQAFEDVCDSVEVMDLDTVSLINYDRDQCAFAYRSSVFKKRHATKDRNFLIWSITLKLAKPGFHQIETGYFSNYESLKAELEGLDNEKPTIQDIYRAVVALRKKKLPDWTNVGTNGSLFMNPIVDGSTVTKLLNRFPKMQYYPTEKMQYVNNTEREVQSTKQYKIAAGHIFDEIGWKGRRVGNVGTWKNHALVLCNYGTHDPGDIIKVITMMQDDFEKATGIRLDPEINIVN